MTISDDREPVRAHLRCGVPVEELAQTLARRHNIHPGVAEGWIRYWDGQHAAPAVPWNYEQQVRAYGQQMRLHYDTTPIVNEGDAWRTSRALDMSTETATQMHEWLERMAYNMSHPRVWSDGRES